MGSVEAPLDLIRLSIGKCVRRHIVWSTMGWRWRHPASTTIRWRQLRRDCSDGVAPSITVPAVVVSIGRLRGGGSRPHVPRQTSAFTSSAAATGSFAANFT